MSKASDLVGRASTAIVLDHPFFASLLLQMPRVEDPSVETACTNGVVIRYNPVFIESLDVDQVAGLLAHEVLHPALGHLVRLPPNLEGNIAGDYAINNFLDNYNRQSSSRKLSLPPGCLIDHKLDDLSAEQILGLLRTGKLNIRVVRFDMRVGAQGAWGEFESQGSHGDSTAEEMGREWERRVVQAATAAKIQQGNVPGCIEKLVDHLVNPRVPWERLLERFVENTAASDYSWARPDRRFLPEDILIPEIYDTTLGEIVVAIDTSGSIFGNQDALASFEAEINAIIHRCQPERVTLIHCDCKIADVEEFPRGEPIKIRAKGGGGTDFRPIGQHIIKRNIDPRVCIYLTDLQGTFPDSPWGFPTIWCVYNNPKATAPFGETIHIPKEI